ncbi:MAG: sigma-70 family RNA polymerase sigma factor [Oscillospiraceae bacterium]|nr:sigma-70 family RNA polymerase sigma factor [Oscillospiraceae bacterium]
MRAKALRLLDDTTLCGQAQAGDRQAEELLILRYTRHVRRCAHPLFLMGGDNEDLNQEGLLGLLSAIRDYRADGTAAFATYAETCIRNRLASAISKANRLKHTPLNSSLSMDVPQLAAVLHDFNVIDPEKWVIEREEGREFAQLLAGMLSSIESRVLQLYCDGYSYREIAAQMNVKSKTVDNAIQRIKKKLRSVL